MLIKIHKTRRTPGYAIASQAILAIILMTATGFIPIRTIQEELPEDLTDLVFPDSYSGRISIEIKSNENDLSDEKNVKTIFKLFFVYFL